jgi:hypothetical protein
MKLRDFMIADQFHKLIQGLGDEAIGLIVAVEKELESVGAPGISWRVDTVETGLLKGLAGKRRDFLLIEHGRFREYRVLVCSHPCGTALHVSWLLMATPMLVNEVKRAFRLGTEKDARFDIGAELDVFDMIDLNAFISITRMAVMNAVIDLTDDGEAEAGDIDGASDLA